MPCGEILEDKDLWNLYILQDNFEKIIIPCEHYCKRHTNIIILMYVNLLVFTIVELMNQNINMTVPSFQNYLFDDIVKD